MITPIIMLVLMIGPYLLVRLLPVGSRPVDAPTAAAIGAGLLFTFTGIGHFIQTDSMAEMLPAWVSARVLIVNLSGVLEFVIALGFFLPRTRRLSGWIAIAVLVMFFPANIYAAINHVPFGGHAWGPVYLLIRGPLQLAILLWVYWFTIRPPRLAPDPGVG